MKRTFSEGTAQIVKNNLINNILTEAMQFSDESYYKLKEMLKTVHVGSSLDLFKTANDTVTNP